MSAVHFFPLKNRVIIVVFLHNRSVIGIKKQTCKSREVLIEINYGFTEFIKVIIFQRNHIENK